MAVPALAYDARDAGLPHFQVIVTQYTPAMLPQL
jgi:hypothetical protein